MLEEEILPASCTPLKGFSQSGPEQASAAAWLWAGPIHPHLGEASTALLRLHTSQRLHPRDLAVTPHPDGETQHQGKQRRKTRDGENRSGSYQRDRRQSASGNGWQSRKEKQGDLSFIIFLSYHENCLSPFWFELLHLAIASGLSWCSHCSSSLQDPRGNWSESSQPTRCEK